MIDYNIVYKNQKLVAGISITLASKNPGNVIKINKLWKEFNSKLWLIKNRVKIRGFVKYGIVYDISPGLEFKYLACVEIEATNLLPLNFTDLILPASNYITVEHQGPLYRLNETFNLIHNKILKENNFKILYTERNILQYERYDERFNWDNFDSIVEIYVPILT